MNQTELLDSLTHTRVIPIFDPKEKADTLEIINALIQGGAKHVEITLRSTLAIEIFLQVREKYPELIMGAGSIIDLEQYELAQNLGTDFTISPGFDMELIQCTQIDKTVHIPGISTATELINARKHGVKIVKFYPAMASGGYKALRDLSRIFTDMHFMPSGSVTEQDLHGFAKIESVISVGGSWMFQQDLPKIIMKDVVSRMQHAITIMKNIN